MSYTRLGRSNMTEKRGSQECSDEEPPLNKARRVARACLQCRARKQRCLPSSEAVSLQTSCKRCEKHGLTCSFQNERIVGPEEIPGPSRMTEIVVELHQKINQHEARISELENQASSTAHHRQFNASPNCQQNPSNEEHCVQPTRPHQPAISPYHSSLSDSPTFTLDGIDLGPPIATLRSLGALTKEESASNSKPLAASKSQPPRESIYDPVANKIMSIDEAAQAIGIFFDHCHAMAPVLNENIRSSWQGMRLSNTVLFLAICSIGTRFKDIHHPEHGDRVHTQLFELTKLLDKAVSRLLLRPTPSDVTLDSIRVLLLYAQWMPCSWGNEDESSVRNSNQSKTLSPPKSRYNEISAWAVLGLALRYALFLGLDRAAIAPFRSPVGVVSQEDVSCLRVWYNLLTCDFNLMLTSGQPASLDPLVSAQVAQRFSSSRHAQQPADLRVAGLVELVAVVHRAMKSCGDVSGRQLDLYCLRKINTELEDWERYWLAILGHTESQHNQLPFNSVRWYRLSLNSAKLGPLLSSMDQPLQISLLQSFEISLTAAAQIIFSLSEGGSKYVWKLDSQNRSSFPNEDFRVDIDAVRRLHYAVDSTWISHTFAVTFLVLCYIRGTIDENIQIRSLNPNCPTNPTLLTPHSDSIMARLLHLALDIFDNVCSTENFHPARDFQAIVHDATSLVLGPGNVQAEEAQEVDELALQSLLDMMNDSGLEWPGNLFDTGGDFSGGWETGGVF